MSLSAHPAHADSSAVAVPAWCIVSAPAVVGCVFLVVVLIVVVVVVVAAVVVVVVAVVAPVFDLRVGDFTTRGGDLSGVVLPAPLST